MSFGCFLRCAGVAHLGKLIDLYSYPVRTAMRYLLADKTTGENIIWATNTYERYGDGYREGNQITPELISGVYANLIQPRILKAEEEQAARTKSKAEVFTPSWVVCYMNNKCDDDWFGRENVFNTLNGEHWGPTKEPVYFEKERDWQRYVDSRRLEITCGEAPYLVSRYAAATGEELPIENRIGILDRKLRVVNENTDNEADWLKWTRRAFEATYGYEYQGDNLLVARINLLMTFVEDAAKETVRNYETQIEERKKNDVEDTIRDHLRGFARTIPSFLMAYGTEDTTLANFDQIVPDEVFQEVTSITLEQFRFLRDGGDYEDTATGETKHFDGKLFDEVVFDDSIKEFLRLKRELANYFDPANEKDIFDYIPPQRTNQIFTPKATVAKMVSLLEEENPGCFDEPDKTFIDLYMKSGLYITEIVKRLYQSEGMKTAFPDPKERLENIFEKQVYGLAPSEIIYRIATNYILGFSKEHNGKQYNFRMCDALPYAKDGTLSEKLDELFG